MTIDRLHNKDDITNILNGMVEGVITINDGGIILSFNNTAETMFGYQRQEVIGNNVSILMPEPDRSCHDDYLNRYITTEDAHIIGIGRNVTAMRKNGDYFPLRLSVTEYPSNVEGERWFIGSCQDITLQKQQEDQLRRTMKMEALGKLTAGISHDFNNILGVIQGYSELLISFLANDQKLVGYAKEIEKAAMHGADLTQKLLSFSRNRPVAKQVININDVLKDSYQLLMKSLSTNISLNMHLIDELWSVFVDKGCLEDVILNLSINARHAMPEGGALEFTTSNIQVDSLNSQLLNIPKGNYVELAITDTGIGMTDELVSHIFEPFFTTKGEKGTGLGLSQAYGFVTDSGGTIKVNSEQGRGSRFSIYLPQFNDQANIISIKK